MEQLNLRIELSDEQKLYEFISSKRTLRLAFKKVKANRGAAGSDGEKLETFEANLSKELDKLHDELTGWTYRPGPVRRVSIPKPGGGERHLGIANVRDRVIQQAIYMALEPLYEPAFSDHSYGFRPGRGQREAISKAKEHVSRGKQWIVDLDLERFFDTVNHDRMIHLLRGKVKDKRLIRLIGLTLNSGVSIEGKVIKSREGLPQGSPLSPLLSNIILNELDKELTHRNLSFVRYADDCNIYVRSQKAAERVLGKVTEFIEKKLKLKVNRAKSKASLCDKVKFLGFTILLSGAIAISASSMSKARAKVKELLPRSAKDPLKKQIETANQWYRGWSEYYATAQYPSQLKTIEARMRARFRLQFIKNYKRKKYLIRKLIKKGLRPKTAYREIYLRNYGRWKLAHTFSVANAWPQSWFEEEGLMTISHQERLHWKPLKLYPKLL